MKQGLNDDVLEAAQGISMSLQGESLKEFLKILVAAVIRDKPANINRHGVGELLFYEAWQADADSTNLISAISELKKEYEWNKQMQVVLDSMEGIVTVPF
jgi:hypothetical protein